MMGRQTVTRKVMAAGLLCAGLLAASAEAGVRDKIRDGLFRNRSSEAVTAPLARYISEAGRVFTLDRTQPTPMLRFDDSPEVWVLFPSPAPRGDIIYKNDLGEPVLRATRLGGYTLFTDDRPNGEAVSMAGGGQPLRLAALSPQAVFERLAQSSLRASRAAHRVMLFEAEATPASSALIADAAVVASVAIIRLAQSADGRRLLAGVTRVRFEEGRRAGATLKDGVLLIQVSPREGLAGRPSSDRIVKVALAR